MKNRNFELVKLWDSLAFSWDSITGVLTDKDSLKVVRKNIFIENDLNEFFEAELYDYDITEI